MSTAPTIRDVAALAHVSVGTVSNTMNCHELVSWTKRKRVHDAIAVLGWTPRGDPQRLASKESHPAAASAPEAHPAATTFFGGTVDLDMDAGSQAVNELTVRLAAQQTAVALTGTGHARLTLQLHADTAEQAALWPIGLVLPLNPPHMRLHVMDAAQDA